MASHLRDDILHGREHEDRHLDAGQWRHQESSSYARHAAPKVVRPAQEQHGKVSDLANFLNTSRIEPPKASPKKIDERYKPLIVAQPTGENGNGFSKSNKNGQVSAPGGMGKSGHRDEDGYDAADRGTGAQNQEYAAGPDGNPQDTTIGAPIADGREVRCGPLLNYRRMEGTSWHGSVMIVVRGGGAEESEFVPELVLKDSSQSGSSNGAASNRIEDAGFSNGGNLMVDAEEPYKGLDNEVRIRGVRLYSDMRNAFWRFAIRVEMSDVEKRFEYEIPGLRFQSQGKTDKQYFYVPATTESMRIMFHSCNGFSVGTDEDAWSGPALWNDVQRCHKEKPFHVMIGGGDQIYNDGIRVDGPLRPWTDISNPKKRRDFKFPESLRKDCDDYYVANYIRWYSTEPFAGANGTIPQLNLWDDHDIIDGFGSYVSDFMNCDVFRGIGGSAYKYYMLFQHHLPPPISTYTTDAPQTMQSGETGVGADPAQTKDTYVLQNEVEEPCYIIGHRPGPYVAEKSRSIYARLGARIAFFGIDARTERTRKQVNYPETYDIIFNRLKKELGAAAEGPSPVRHLVVLLGIPVAYPRLTWLENILTSPLIGPIKFLNKRFGVGGSLFNKFDGGVDLLDDLDDHYTAKTHKRERHDLVHRLQDLASSFSVRVTILGGDVHLAALGRFYSNPKLEIPVEADHRYMTNVISSAIVNKPPPAAVANLLARRNKIHHLDEDTDETLLKMFDRSPGEVANTASSNKVTMPSRNFAMITENSPHALNPTVPGHALRVEEHSTDGAGLSAHSAGGQGVPHIQIEGSPQTTEANNEFVGRDGHSPLSIGEATAGSKSRAALPDQHGNAGDGSIDICIRVEKNQHDKEGRTVSYGLSVPHLAYSEEMGKKTLAKEHYIHRPKSSRSAMSAVSAVSEQA